MCRTVSALKGESVPWAFVRGDWGLGLGVEGLYFVLPSPPDRLVMAGRLLLSFQDAVSRELSASSIHALESCHDGERQDCSRSVGVVDVPAMCCGLTQEETVDFMPHPHLRPLCPNFMESFRTLLTEVLLICNAVLVCGV